jgi:DNA-binding transcriptional regulator LsrR (DeoR family)
VIGLMETLQPRTVEVKGATVVHKLDKDEPQKHVTFTQAIAIERERLERNEKRRLNAGTEERRKRIIAVLRRFQNAQIEWTSAYSISRSTGIDFRSITNLLASMREDGLVKATPNRSRLYGAAGSQSSGLGWMLND